MQIKCKICCGKWFMSNSVCDQHAIFCRRSPITFDFKEEATYREQDLSLATMSLHCWQNSLSTTQEVETAGQWTKSCCSWFASQWREKKKHRVLKFGLVAVSIVAMHLTETLLMWAFKDRHDWRALEPNATILTMRSVSFSFLRWRHFSQPFQPDGVAEPKRTSSCQVLFSSMSVHFAWELPETPM